MTGRHFEHFFFRLFIGSLFFFFLNLFLLHGISGVLFISFYFYFYNPPFVCFCFCFNFIYEFQRNVCAWIGVCWKQLSSSIFHFSFFLYYPTSREFIEFVAISLLMNFFYFIFYLSEEGRKSKRAGRTGVVFPL
jgi:hypothetical protein